MDSEHGVLWTNAEVMGLGPLVAGGLWVHGSVPLAPPCTPRALEAATGEVLHHHARELEERPTVDPAFLLTATEVNALEILGIIRSGRRARGVDTDAIDQAAEQFQIARRR